MAECTACRVFGCCRQPASGELSRSNKNALGSIDQPSLGRVRIVVFGTSSPGPSDNSRRRVLRGCTVRIGLENQPFWKGANQIFQGWQLWHGNCEMATVRWKLLDLHCWISTVGIQLWNETIELSQALRAASAERSGSAWERSGELGGRCPSQADHCGPIGFVRMDLVHASAGSDDPDPPR